MRTFIHFLVSAAMSVWVFGCAGSPSQEEAMESIRNFSASIESANRATQIINSGEASSIVAPEDSEEMIRHFASALAHAEGVDVLILNDAYPEWGNRYEQFFREGLRAIIDGNTNLDLDASLRGQRLLDEWDAWYSDNLDGIRNSG